MSRSLYNRLQFNIVMLILFISLTPFLLLGGIIFHEFSYMYRNKIEEQIKYRARVQANALDFFLKERTAIVAGIANLYNFDTLVQGDELARIFEIMNSKTGGFVDLGVIDDNGQHLAYVGPYKLEGLNYYRQPWFAQVMSKGIFISDVYMGYRQIPHFIIAVRRQENHHSWILRATIDSDVFNVLVREAKVGKTGDAFIINKDGVYQTEPRFDAVVLSESGLDPTLFGEGAVIEEKSPDGIKNIYTGSWLDNKEWLLVIKQDADEGMSGFVRTRNAQIMYMFLGCIAIIIVTVFSTNFTVRRLEKVFQKKGEVNAKLLQADKLAALGKMAAGIAHEINNPLAVIGEKTGWMQDLLEDEEFKDSPSYEEYKTSLEKISLHVDRTRKIIYNMLNYARKMEPHLEDVSINDVITQTVGFLGNIARINNIEIETALDPDIPIISNDQAKLQQVFLNMINNAIDAIGKDGLVRIRTSREDSQLVIDIEDNGPGIPRDIQKKIFDPFFSTKQAGAGTGLGLWICFDIVEGMGGVITLKSEEGKGSKFSVRLPIVLPEKK